MDATCRETRGPTLALLLQSMEGYGVTVRLRSDHSSLIILLEVMGPDVSRERVVSLASFQAERITGSKGGYRIER